jgi:hypothetical protein
VQQLALHTCHRLVENRGRGSLLPEESLAALDEKRCCLSEILFNIFPML